MSTAPQPRDTADSGTIDRVLGNLTEPCFIVDTPDGIGATTTRPAPATETRVLAAAPPLPPGRLGDPLFLRDHGLAYAYMAGAMAGGIASEDLVIALARAGFLGSFGAAGLLPEQVARALERFQREIPALPYACNLIHSPHEERLEREVVAQCLAYGVRCVEASAYLDLTPHVVRYRVAGLSRDATGRVRTAHRVIAKVSSEEVARRFMEPPPEPIVADLAARGEVTAEQADLARRVPMADDITVEADSGGHTDRRPLVSLFPVIARLRDRVQAGRGDGRTIRLGAAGGIGTPEAAAAAFAMGAAYVVTGSVNQSCVEAGTSRAVKAMLAAAGIADCAMAPAADMFELGAELQVLRRGTLFPMRAQHLRTLYRTYDGLDALPPEERHRLETRILGRTVEEVWEETVRYFGRRDPEQLRRAEGDPKRAMALVFRWYLGLSSHWARRGEPERTADYQIWCGPAMGSFNTWVRGTWLAVESNRRVADVARHLMTGAALASRVAQLRLAGVRLPAGCGSYHPRPRPDAAVCEGQPGTRPVPEADPATAAAGAAS
ncbi:PfaD family polyunsaturated fatty acid/polyketide biosynthesis protein [Streptomyces celluloflavus]|uniref:PfaD family polyunsaturated fatty acid/polyketide biosynthesis protein n=1 Tax=Streptomyces celluloflavus TaxID=58344 RepID=UPI0036B7DEC3